MSVTNITATKKIERLFEESIATKQQCLAQGMQSIAIIGDEIVAAIERGNKMMFCGNGGSAADAQHLAAEMLVRLRPSHNRAGLPAMALTLDNSTITACCNDFGYNVLFERMVMSLGREGDCLIGISTSGNSENVIRAMKAAKAMNLKVFGFLGNQGGEARQYCDEAFIVPGNVTGRVQEAHITGGHALMEYIEDGLLSSGYLQLQE